MNIENLIKELSNSVCIGNIKSASEIAKRELSKYATVRDFGTLGVIGEIHKGAKRTLMLDAHIDEVGFVVTSIMEDGFLKVANIGGIDSRILPALPVTVHGKKDVTAVFASTPPHLLKGEDTVKETEDIFLDTGLGSRAKDIISVGDFVTFSAETKALSGTRLSGKSLDDRSAVACLIEVASRIYDRDLPFNIIICLSEYEELGTRGAKTASFELDCDEAIAIDVSFADAPDVSADKCGKLGYGGMIGVSPVLDKKITNTLMALAQKSETPYQLEVMGGVTGTDADSISIAKSGVPCGLISIPLRNMHTPQEVIDLKDIESVCDILEGYILSGGGLHD